MGEGALLGEVHGSFYPHLPHENHTSGRGWQGSLNSCECSEHQMEQRFSQDAARTACPSVVSQVTFKQQWSRPYGEGGQWQDQEQRRTGVSGEGQERDKGQQGN